MEQTIRQTQWAQQAAFDRNLFQGTARVRHIDLKFPEIFNTGSAMNVPAGQGGANLDRLVAHYQKLNRETEERRVQRMQKQLAVKGAAAAVKV